MTGLYVTTSDEIFSSMYKISVFTHVHLLFLMLFKFIIRAQKNNFKKLNIYLEFVLKILGLEISNNNLRISQR